MKMDHVFGAAGATPIVAAAAGTSHSAPKVAPPPSVMPQHERTVSLG